MITTVLSYIFTHILYSFLNNRLHSEKAVLFQLFALSTSFSTFLTVGCFGKRQQTLTDLTWELPK